MHTAIKRQYGGTYDELKNSVETSRRSRGKGQWTHDNFAIELEDWGIKLSALNQDDLLHEIEGDQPGTVDFSSFEKLLKVAFKGPPQRIGLDDSDSNDSEVDNDESYGDETDQFDEDGGFAHHARSQQRGSRSPSPRARVRRIREPEYSEFDGYYSRTVEQVAARFAVSVAAAAVRGVFFWQSCSLFARTGPGGVAPHLDQVGAWHRKEGRSKESHQPEMITRDDFEHVVATKLRSVAASDMGGSVTLGSATLPAFDSDELAALIAPLRSLRTEPSAGAGDMGADLTVDTGAPQSSTHAARSSGDLFDAIELRGAIGAAVAAVAPGALSALGGAGLEPGTLADRGQSVLVGYGPYAPLAHAAAATRHGNDAGMETGYAGTALGTAWGGDGLPVPLDAAATVEASRAMALDHTLRGGALANASTVHSPVHGGMGDEQAQLIDPALRQKLRERVQRHAEAIGVRGSHSFRLLEPFERLDLWNRGELPVAQFKRVSCVAWCWPNPSSFSRFVLFSPLQIPVQPCCFHRLSAKSLSWALPATNLTSCSTFWTHTRVALCHIASLCVLWSLTSLKWVHLQRDCVIASSSCRVAQVQVRAMAQLVMLLQCSTLNAVDLLRGASSGRLHGSSGCRCWQRLLRD